MKRNTFILNARHVILSEAKDLLAIGFCALYVLDRLLKLAAVVHFFRRPLPPDPPVWPSITLFQPITRGVSGLQNSLKSRVQLSHDVTDVRTGVIHHAPAAIQHLLICDANDAESQEESRRLLAEFPTLNGEIILVEANGGVVASKTEKLLAALPHATGDVFWFIDDDIALRPTALRLMIPFLYQPGVGAAFGLACYTNWRRIWSSLMSVFVNANALLSYIPLTYLTDPFTITGHCFALKREIFHKVGGFVGLERRIDDDHELARRVRKLGLRCIQTPMIYDVDNDFDSLQAYNKQMKRWFIFPRQAMLPLLKTVTILSKIQLSTQSQENSPGL